MALAISSVTTGTNNGSSATVSTTTSESPTATQVGDLVFFWYDNDFYTIANMGTPSATGSPTINAVTAATADDTASGSHIKAFWYFANTAGAQTISATETGNHDEDKSIDVYVITGADGTTPIDDASNTVQSTSTSPHVVTGVTPTGATDLLITHLRSSRSASSGGWTAPGGTTKQYDLANFTRLAGGTEQLSSSGATGTRTWTPVGSSPFVAAMVAIKTASAAASIPYAPQRYVMPADTGRAPWLQHDLRDANTVATPANPLPSPLDSAWQAGARYWHLYGDSADAAPRTWQSLQRQYISDPNLLAPAATIPPPPARTVQGRDPGEVWWQQPARRDPNLLTTAELENELLGSVDDLARHRSNAATHADRRLVPQQRVYVSDPNLLTTAQLENELLGSVDDLARHRHAAAYTDRRMVPQQRPYIAVPGLLDTAELENELLGSADDLRRRYNQPATHADRRMVPQQRGYLSDPLLLATALLENELLGGAQTALRYNTPATHTARWWMPQQPARQTVYFDAGPDVPPLTLAYGAGGVYTLLYLTAAWQPDRREVPQQRPYISDPSFYPTVAPVDPLTVAWGAGGPLWWLYNTAAAQVDRRQVPQQRRYISDPNLLATAQLENELLGSADDLRRRYLTAAYGDRRQAGQQRPYYDPSLLASAQLENELLGGAGTWARYTQPATHADRRAYPAQRLYQSDPLLLTTALLEGPLLGGADDRARHATWFTDRRLMPQQPLRYDPSLLTPPVPADPLLLAGGVGGDTWRRINMAAFTDRRVMPWQPPRGTVLFLPSALRDLVLTVGEPALKWVLLQLLPNRWQVANPRLRWVVGTSMATSLSTVSLEYIRVPVSATVAGSPVNPTTDPVAMAFVAPGATPAPGDWQMASWDTAGVSGPFVAQCLVGPGGTIALQPGDYTVWVRLTDNPEIPARPAGPLRVY